MNQKLFVDLVGNILIYLPRLSPMKTVRIVSMRLNLTYNLFQHKDVQIN